MPTALPSVRNAIPLLCHEDRDLVHEDLKDAKERCLHNHCKRVWWKLTPEQRDAVRDLVRDDGPPMVQNALYLDFACLREIGQMISDAGCYPVPDEVLALDLEGNRILE